MSSQLGKSFASRQIFWPTVTVRLGVHLTGASIAWSSTPGQNLRGLSEKCQRVPKAKLDGSLLLQNRLSPMLLGNVRLRQIRMSSGRFPFGNLIHKHRLGLLLRT
jgi:hypothetical protein